MMNTCPLCKKKEANQTGSHIFTHALIKTAINDAGNLKRDKEIMYTLSSLNLESHFIGRSITDDRINEVLGKSMTEEDIEKNINTLVIDNLVCDVCEKRFTTAENYFITNIYQKLPSNDFRISNDSNKNEVISFSETEINIDLIRLFFYIQIWRASASNHEKFRLKHKLEKKMAKIIDENLDLNYDTTIANCKKNSTEIRSFPVLITFVKTEINSKTKKEHTQNIVFVSSSKMPYYFVINDISIQFYEKESHVRSSIDYIYGVKKIIPINEHINFNETDFKIGVLSDSNRKTLLESYNMALANAFIHRLRSFFSYVHKLILGVKPSNYFVDNAVQKVIKSDDYSPDNVIKIYAETIKDIHTKMRY